ncbi:MAG: hypothetical protein KDE27_21740 [Planctomycetes bacterium]|nr:hypothetical protein [Planctomycetota bacterium]
MMLLSEDPSPWLQVLGRCHPLVLHLPLGLIPALVLLEFGAPLLRRDSPRGPIAALAWLNAVGAALAAVTGLLLASENDSTGELLGNHKLAGIALGALCVISAIAASVRRRGPFRVLLLLSFVVMLPTGHLGGSITHGKDFLFEPLEHSRTAKPPTPTGDNGTEPAPIGSEYERVIAPILERTCSKCHNPDKTKGELLLTTPEGIQRGGENGTVLVAGKPDESELLVRCLLPLDDDDHMPPEDKPQPSAEELAALRAWIAGGAKF